MSVRPWRAGAWVLLLALVLIHRLAAAAPLARDAVPEPLKPWVPWVLYGHETYACPPLFNDAATRSCVWPSMLEIDAAAGGGRFRYTVDVLAPDQSVPLPGGADSWPDAVQVDRQPAAAMARNDVPELIVPPGRHVITGTLRWSRLPAFLKVPPAGVLRVTRDGAALDALPDASGRMWFASTGAVAAQPDLLTVRRFRLIEDGVPMTVRSRFEIEVGGRAREATIPVALLGGFIPIDLISDLPARLDPEGDLRVQVRPGRWIVQLSERSVKPAAELVLAKQAGAEEVWSFAARPEFRAVTAGGAPAVDPKLVSMPEEWRRYPAYAIAPGGRLTLVETRRGDANPAPDRLDLKRTLWLDFDGGGYTAQDVISGSFSRSWRMSVAPGVALERAAIDGVDQLVTRSAPGSPAGFEVRRGRAGIVAESRLERGGAIAASGWSSDFNSAAAVLILPPGWRLLHAAGVDRAAGSWSSQWTLYDFFFVLIGTLAVAKLFGWRAGLLAFAALVLSWHIGGAPRTAWFVVLIAVGLLRVLPSGRLRWAVDWFSRAALLAVALIWIPFAIAQVREAIYPSLELDSAVRRTAVPETAQKAREATARRAPVPGAPPPAAPAPPFSAAEEALTSNMAGMSRDMAAGVERLRSSPSGGAVPAPAQGAAAGSGQLAGDTRLQQLAAGGKIQTGSGLPDWQWRSCELLWNGPVLHDQSVRLWLTGPRTNALLDLLRVVLTALLLAMLAQWKSALRWPRRPGGEASPPHAPSAAPSSAGPQGVSASSPEATAGVEGASAGASAASAGSQSVASSIVVVCFTTLLLAALAPGPATAAERGGERPAEGPSSIPTPALLDELRDRLTAPPACMPACADVARMAIEAAGDRVQIRLDIQAGAEVAVPLPGQASQWSPAEVTLDGAPAILRRDERGTLWVRTPAGVHVVTMTAAATRSSVELTLPLRPRHVQTALEGWQASGIDDDGRPADAIVLTRAARAGARDRDAGSGGGGEAAGNDRLERDALPPFVQIERTIGLGLDWTVSTRITRIGASQAPLVVRIRLLEGETPTSADVKVDERMASLNLGAARQAVFRSTLAPADRLNLVASDGMNQIEVWRLDAATLWHVELSGIPVVHQQSGGLWLPQWNPWPGERAVIAVSRPQPVEGATLTLESSTREVSPGLRSTDVTLDLVLRSSQGGAHTVTLPERAQLLGVRIDGVDQPAQLEGRALRLPVRPGLQQIRLNWREPRGMSVLFRTEAFDGGIAGVNASLNLILPPERWLLWTGGPRLGPAVLYWGFVLVLAVVAWGLTRTGIGPLGAGAWFLLGLGLAQSSLGAAAVPVAWFGLLTLRRKLGARLSGAWFNLLQVVIVIATFFTATVVLDAVRQGLLGTPDMQVAGNGSTAQSLWWFSDRHGTTLPEAWIVSIPVMAYRVIMLAWALWLAWAILRWAQWGWSAWSDGGLWRPAPPRPPKRRPAHSSNGAGSAASPASTQPSPLSSTESLPPASPQASPLSSTQSSPPASPGTPEPQTSD